MSDPTKIYLNPVEKDPIKQNSAVRQLIEVAAASPLSPSTTTIGDVATWGSTTGTSLADSTFVNINPSTGLLSVLGNGISTLSVNSLNQGLNVSQQGTTHTTSGSDFYWNQIELSNDEVNLGPGPGVSSVALYIQQLISAGATGQRYALRGLSQIHTSSAVTQGDVTGVSGIAYNIFPNGGTNTGAGSAGTAYGLEGLGHLGNGGTNYTVCAGAELDAFIDTGASAKHRWGVSLPSGGNVHGASTDAAVQISASGSLFWLTGVLFSTANGGAPLDSTGTVIGTDGVSNTVTNFADFSAWTFTGKLFNFTTFQVDGSTGNITGSGGLALNKPTTQTGSYVMAAGDNSIIFNVGGSASLTLLSAASNPGRMVYVKTIQPQLVVSASSNVVPLAGGSPGTALLSNTAGKWAILQSDGSNWQIMAAN